MSDIITVGLDLAKNVFQLHGAYGAGRVFLEFFGKLPACFVAMEACGGAHFWGREIGKLGNDVRLIPPIYVKPFVKRQKMGRLPPSPYGIAMCQGCGVQRHEKERTANQGYNDRCGFGKERLPASPRQLGWAFEISQEGDADPISAFHGVNRLARMTPYRLRTLTPLSWS